MKKARVAPLPRSGDALPGNISTHVIQLERVIGSNYCRVEKEQLVFGRNKHGKKATENRSVENRPAENTLADAPEERTGKGPILGQSHELSEEEGQMIQQMIREEQHSSRQLYIPQEDLSQEATTQMKPEVAQVIKASRVREVLHMFNRDYLYGQGRFDEYQGGLILKWGDGYSRKHIWMSVENGNLIFETSHFKKCDKPYCNGTHHILGPEQYSNLDIINEELGERFRRPVYERSED